MKKLKRSLSTFLALIMILTIIPVMPVKAESSGYSNVESMYKPVDKEPCIKECEVKYDGALTTYTLKIKGNIPIAQLGYGAGSKISSWNGTTSSYDSSNDVTEVSHQAYGYHPSCFAVISMKGVQSQTFFVNGAGDLKIYSVGDSNTLEQPVTEAGFIVPLRCKFERVEWDLKDSDSNSVPISKYQHMVYDKWDDVHGCNTSMYYLSCSKLSIGTYTLCVTVYDIGENHKEITVGSAEVKCIIKNEKPKITKHPSAVSTVIGTEATFTVKADGTNNEYQWYMANDSVSTGSKISNATSAMYTIQGASVDETLNNKYFYCTVSNEGNPTVTSNRAKLTIISAPTAPTFSAEINSNSWSNKAVTLGLTGSSISGSTKNVGYKYSLDGGTTWKDYSKEFIWSTDTKASTIIAKAYNTQYQTSVSPESRFIVKYDATAPVISKVDSNAQQRKVTVTATDATSGVSAYALAAKGTESSEVSWQSSNVLAAPSYGTYKVMAKDVAGNIATYAESVAILGKLSVTANNSTATYDGKEHSTSVSADSGSTIKYGTASGQYNLSTMPKFTDAGVHTVYYKVTKENYEDVTGSVNITINKADGTATASAKDVVYGNAVNVIGTSSTNGSSYTITYKKSNEADSAYTGTVPTNVGSYIAKVSFPENKNYNACTATCKFNITAATGSVTAEDVTVSYDGKPHTVSASWDGATIEYGAEKDTYNLNTAPAYTNAGVYKVYYKATKANYNDITGTITLTINKAEGSASADDVKAVYNGKPHTIDVKAEGATVTYSTDSKTYDLNTAPTYTDAGTYKIYYKAVKENYTDAIGSATVTINKAIGNAVISTDNVTFGNNVNIVVKYSTNGSDFTAQYKASDADDTSYTDKMPTAVGSYMVKAVFPETKNYKECSATSSFEIVKADGNATIKVDNVVVGSDVFVVATSKTNGDEYTVWYKASDADDDSYTTDAPTKVGSYVAKVVFSATESYKEAISTCPFEIVKAGELVNKPISAMTVPYTVKTVGEVSLADYDGWVWEDGSVALEVGVPCVATAKYTGADAGNYEVTATSVTITRSACTHTNTSVTVGKLATCTEDGYTEKVTCDDCKAVIKESTVIPKTGHTWDAGVVTKEPSYTETGTKTYTCTSCHETKTEEIPALTECAHEHTSITKEAKEATCTEDGYTEEVTCDICHAVIKKSTIIEAKGHQWNDGVITVEPTVDAEGEKTFTCTVCKETKTEPIAKLDKPDTGNTDKPSNGGNTGDVSSNPTQPVVPSNPAGGNGATTDIANDNGTTAGITNSNGTDTNNAVKKPGKPKFKHIKTRKKIVKVSWKKVKGAKGYQLQYSKKANMKHSKKKIVNSTHTVIKKLSKNKKYYVRVRAYKKVNGKKVYGAWSKKKTMKIK